MRFERFSCNRLGLCKCICSIFFQSTVFLFLLTAPFPTPIPFPLFPPPIALTVLQPLGIPAFSTFMPVTMQAQFVPFNFEQTFAGIQITVAPPFFSDLSLSLSPIFSLCINMPSPSFFLSLSLCLACSISLISLSFHYFLSLLRTFSYNFIKCAPFYLRGFC